MRFLTPVNPPPLSYLLLDLGRPSPRELARYLDVTERTVYRWLAADNAPTPVMMALFWLTNYGRSEIYTTAENELRQLGSLTVSLRNELQQMHVRVAWLEKNGRFDTANQPFFAPVSLPDTRISAVS